MRDCCFLLIVAFSLSACEPPSSAKALPPGAAPAQSPSTPAAQNPPAIPTPSQPIPEAPDNGGKDSKNLFSKGLKLGPEAQEIQDLRTEAQSAIEAKDFKTAHDRLSLLLELAPGDRLAAIDKAKVCRMLGKLDEALSTLDAALQKHTEDVTLLEAKAYTLFEKGDPRGALDVIGRITARDMAVPSGRYLRAVIHASLGEREPALAALDDAVEHSFLDIARIESEKHLQLLAAEPRFQAIVQRIRQIREGARRTEDILEIESPPERLPELGRVDGLEVLGELSRRLARGNSESVTIDTKDLDGKPLRLSDYKNRAVIVLFWGTWSQWGRKQIEDLQRVRNEYAAKGLEAITLCYEISADPNYMDEVALSVRAFLRDSKIMLPCAVVDKELTKRLRVSIFPSTLFVARDGKSYLNAGGYFGFEPLKRMADTLLQGPLPAESSASPASPEAHK